MNSYETYNNLKKEKQILVLRIEDFEEEALKLAELAKIYGPSDMKAIDYGSTAVKSTSQIDFKYYLERREEIVNHVYLHRERIEKIDNLLEDIENILKELKGKHYDVAFKRFVDGKTQEKIAEEMDLSTRQVRRIEKELKELMKCPVNVL